MLSTRPAIATLTAILASTLFAGAQAAGTPQTIQMINLQASVDKAVDARKSKAGDPFVAKTTAGSALNDGTTVPAGSVLEGHIDSVTPSANKGDSTLVVTIDKLQIKNGKEIGIKATIVQVATVEHEPSDKGYSDPSSYAPGTVGNNGRANGPNGASAPHPIEGLTLTGTPHDAFSGTFTQAKKNVHLSSGTLLLVSVAVVPPGGILQ